MAGIYEWYGIDGNGNFEGSADTVAGMYEQQDSKQREFNLRGKFITDDQGRYSFYCLRPTPYPVSSAW